MSKFKMIQISLLTMILILSAKNLRIMSDKSVDYLMDEWSADDNHSTTTNESSIDDQGEKKPSKHNCLYEENEPSFVDKWKQIYEQGKNVPIDKHVKHINETTNVLKTFKQNIGFLLKSSDNSREIQKALKYFNKIDLGLSSQCSTSLTRVLMAVLNGEIWALKFLDSAGRLLPSGLAEGVYSEFGEYSECLGIIDPHPTEGSPIKGRYCLVKTIIPFPPIGSYSEKEPMVDIKILSALLKHYGLVNLATTKAVIEQLNRSGGVRYQMGICIPSQCSAYEFQQLLNVLLLPITRIPLEVGPQCSVKDETKPLDKYQIISLAFFSISSLMIILSTGYEIYTNSKHEDKRVEISDVDKQLLTSFSIMRNTKLLFTRNDNFPALDTIRLLVIMNVHVLHLYGFASYKAVVVMKKIYSDVMIKQFGDNRYIFVRNPLIIDILMTLSGFLLSLTILRKLDKTRGRFSYFRFIFDRWIRFAVLLFGSIIFFYVFPLTGDGPIWNLGIISTTSGCKDPWVLLKMLFLVHNLKIPDRASTSALPNCNPSTWYLPVLFQFTLIGPIFIVLYHKKSFYGIIAIITAIILSVFASIAPQILFNIRPWLQIWDLETTQFPFSKSFTWWHFMPNNYCTAFFVGIAFGYLMRNNIQISRSKSAFFWILSTVLCTAVYFWFNTFWRLDRSAPLISVLLWHSIGKLIFSLGCGWIYFACCTGRGGYFNKILSWHGFQPIARLSFGMFMLHHLVISHRLFSFHYTMVITNKQVFETVLIDLVYDTFLAYIFYICIESPFYNVFNHIMAPKVNSVVPSTPGSNSDNKNKLN